MLSAVTAQHMQASSARRTLVMIFKPGRLVTIKDALLKIELRIFDFHRCKIYLPDCDIETAGDMNPAAKTGAAFARSIGLIIKYRQTVCTDGTRGAA